MKKKEIIFFVIGFIVIVCLVVIGVNYFNNLKPYKLSLPEINEVKKISLKFDKYQNDSTNVHTIKEIFNILNNVKKRTYKESVQEYPNDVNNLIEISFYAFEKDSSAFIHEDNNLFYNNIITIYVYEKNNKYFLEQSYNGIYKITKENYTDLKEIYNDINLLSCLVNQTGAYIMSENSEIKDMPLSTFTTNEEEILYYNSSYADAENIYAIVKTYDGEVIGDFDKYFSSKYNVYQTYFVNDNIYIYVHNKLNDIDFSDLKQCSSNLNKINTEDVKKMDSKTIEKLNNTDKIVINSGNNELGTIKNKEAINELLTIIAGSKRYGDTFLTDGHQFELKMYNDDKQIDAIYVWRDGRLVPESIQGGYFITSNNVNIIEIIERETDYISYTLFSLTDSCEENEKIYSDEKYNYYLNCKEHGKMLIKFNTKNLKMNLKYALDNNYITLEHLSAYDEMIIKEEK